GRVRRRVDADGGEAAHEDSYVRDPHRGGNHALAEVVDEILCPGVLRRGLRDDDHHGRVTPGAVAGGLDECHPWTLLDGLAEPCHGGLVARRRLHGQHEGTVAP